jgi:NitT/TauT family transport system substrate-binding protein
MVRPDSPHNYPGTLGHRPIAVQFHAGSHYVALRLLEGYLPNDKIKLVHYGSPQQRFEAMWRGEVDACVVMEPWIALAEKLGCKALDLLNADKRRYLHYLIDDARYAEALAKYGGLTPDDFHLPRLRYAKATPYTDEIVADTYHWMVRWGLIDPAASTDDLVDNRVVQTAALLADDA